MGCYGTTSAAALDGVGVREALLLLALAFAAAGCADGSRLAALGFAAALGSEAARFGASFSGIGVDSIFAHAPAFASSAACFPLRRIASLINVGSVFQTVCS